MKRTASVLAIAFALAFIVQFTIEPELHRDNPCAVKKRIVRPIPPEIKRYLVRDPSRPETTAEHWLRLEKERMKREGLSYRY